MKLNSIKTKLAVVGAVPIVLFLVLILAYLVPSMGDSIYEEKRTQSREMVNVALNVVDELYQQAEQGEISEEEARQQAIDTVRSMRFGPDDQEYFFLLDYEYYTLAHPDPDFEGTDTSDLQDPEGTYIVREAVDIARAEGSGYFEYL